MRLTPTVTLALVLASRAVYAQRAPQTPPLTSHEHDAPHAVVPAWWDMNDSESLTRRIRQVAAGDPALAARHISAALLHGVEPDVAATGLHTLAALARPEGAHAVQRFLDHRRPLLRRHAVAAALAIGGRELARAVEVRVGDADADVRGDAAAALGEMGERAALPMLFTALDRELESTLGAEGTPLERGCAHSIARLGTEADLERLLGYLRRAPLRSLTESFTIVLGRRDVSETLKTRAVTLIGNLATPDARTFLVRVTESWRGAPTAWVAAARSGAARIQVPGGEP